MIVYWTTSRRVWELSLHEDSRQHATSQGSVDLGFAVRSGWTRLVKRRVRPPFVVQRCLYLDSRQEDMAYVFLANPTAGIFQGDHQRISIAAGPGAKAHVTTQSATKVHTMPEGSASQEIELTVEDRGYLEYLPEPLIPFKGSRFSQSTTITVAPMGTLLYGDVITPGRIARGEILAYESLEIRLMAISPGGPPIYREAYRLEPKRRSPLTATIFGRFDTPVLGSFLAVAGPVGSQSVADELLAAAACETERSPEIEVGVSRLPQGSGVGVKILGSETQRVKSALMCLASRARTFLTGYPLPSPRKY